MGDLGYMSVCDSYVLAHILQFIYDPITICKVRATCRTLRAIANDIMRAHSEDPFYHSHNITWIIRQLIKRNEIDTMQFAISLALDNPNNITLRDEVLANRHMIWQYALAYCNDSRAFRIVTDMIPRAHSRSRMFYPELDDAYRIYPNCNMFQWSDVRNIADTLIMTIRDACPIPWSKLYEYDWTILTTFQSVKDKARELFMCANKCELSERFILMAILRHAYFNVSRNPVRYSDRMEFLTMCIKCAPRCIIDLVTDDNLMMLPQIGIDYLSLIDRYRYNARASRVPISIWKHYIVREPNNHLVTILRLLRHIEPNPRKSLNQHDVELLQLVPDGIQRRTSNFLEKPTKYCDSSAWIQLTERRNAQHSWSKFGYRPYDNIPPSLYEKCIHLSVIDHCVKRYIDGIIRHSYKIPFAREYIHILMRKYKYIYAEDPAQCLCQMYKCHPLAREMYETYHIDVLHNWDPTSYIALPFA